MASCSHCGEQNPTRANYCLACGAPMPSEAGQDVRKTVTVLFADLVGSTELGERLDPESVRRVMSRYFTEMRTILERHGATVEKFIGDAIMAAFGVPVVREDDALRAVRAAAEMRERIGVLNDEFDREWGVRLKVRTGINTGEVVAGDPSRAESFVSGDTVNVAARLEQSAPADEILLGERTWSLARDVIEAAPVEALTLKGKSEALPAWRLIAVSPPAPRGYGHDDSPFVGRTKQLDELHDALERAINDRTCVVATIVGPPGIGKSRLVREFTTAVAERARVVTGRCLPYGDGITYWPLVEIVNEVGSGDMRDAVAELLGEDAPVAVERIAAAVGSGQSTGSPAEIFWAFRKLFEGLARQKPLIAVVDDIHWAEPTLLDLLEYIIGFASDAPMLVLCLARREIFDARPSWAEPRPNAVLLPLQPISEGDASALIEHLTTRGFSEALRTRVADAAEGNPLFIEQLLALNVDVRTEGDAIVVPPTIQALLAARIDRLGPGDRAVIERASVEGRSFHRGAVAELLDEQSRSTLGACLISLVRKEFIQPDEPLFRDDDGFRFGHMLIRDAAYEAVPKQLRAHLHERFAAWLEQAAGDAVADYQEILAYHLEQAYRYQAELGRSDEVARLAGQAGNRLATTGLRAFARGDLHAAISLMSRAVEIMPVDDPARMLLLPELATVLTEAGEFAAAGTTLQEAETLAAANAHELARWRATVARLWLQMWTGMFARDHMVALAEAAVAACAEFGDDLGVARAWHLLGLLRTWAGNSAEGQDAFEQAVIHAQRADAGREESSALQWVLISSWFGPTPASEGIRRCEEILAQPTNRTVEAIASTELGCFLAMQAEFASARSHFMRGYTILEDLGQQLAAAGSSEEYFDIEMLAGNPAGAERRLRQACQTLEEMGDKGFLATRLGCLAEAVYAQGRFAEAEEISERVEAAAASDPDDLDPQFRWRAVRGKTMAQRGEFTAGEQLVREAADLISSTDWLDARAGMQSDLADVMELAGRNAEARTHLQEALRLFDAKGNEVAAARVRSRLATLESRQSPGGAGG